MRTSRALRLKAVTDMAAAAAASARISHSSITGKTASGPVAVAAVGARATRQLSTGVVLVAMVSTAAEEEVSGKLMVLQMAAMVASAAVAALPPAEGFLRRRKAATVGLAAVAQRPTRSRGLAASWAVMPARLMLAVVLP